MIIHAQIATPQFKNGKVWYYHKQFGDFDTKTLKFEPSTWPCFRWANGDHTVQFSSVRQFKKSVIKQIL